MAAYPESEAAQRALVGDGWVFESDYAEKAGPEWLDESLERWAELDATVRRVGPMGDDGSECIPIKAFANATTCLVSILIHIGATRTKFIRDDLNMRLEQVRTKYAERGEQPEDVVSAVDADYALRDPIMHLKRGISFIALMLDKFCSTDWSLRAAAKDAYSVTLGIHHGWSVRSAVKLALYALPSRDTFLETLSPGDKEQARVKLHKLFAYVWPRALFLNSLYAARDYDDQLPGDASVSGTAPSIED
ncbi:uncharacterized protein AMSG_00942 [Thecamonas trahens ATCC 50062]|uniref:Glycolipid transfer protein domain-containing protein n=1 Tax=Thecamonas trahens ATCC 50062 TaxID=461836 RepID=A0A0L0DIU9_THETB|nr:hypothetical protein AMSG_00942 [Thecamonas trahens ATCC 50062]KNC52115.1 hypothetical protein AMSG_00942 [Thecamonas trahens ATCC 50062]|eukprot:XP_013762119.1 hypothetical protein AMSG_00942 [Thecamonas trahens ATCC 50062]